ncbi:MAG TPA: nuclear transport factor 2 family protein [Chloroflexota bacterium]|jgi:ketosteroid isomerase-like protein
MTDVTSTTFDDAHAIVNDALVAIRAGDPEPWIQCWADSEDVTLFGAWGPVEKGHDRLVQTFRWVGNRFKSGTVVVEDTVAFQSGDLAYTVGFEHGEAAIDADATQPLPIRVTHVYRRFDGQWRLVHRHADFPPEDPRLR